MPGYQSDDSQRLAAEWTDHGPSTLRWSIDATAYAVMGAMIRSSNDYPVNGPYPTTWPDGRRMFTPGRLTTITIHKTRGVELVGTRGTYNQEVCRHHYGGWTVNRRGRLAPIVFCRPNNLRDVAYVSVGKIVCVDPSTRADLLNLHRPGHCVGLVTLNMPEWIEGCFHSRPRICGEVE